MTEERFLLQITVDYNDGDYAERLSDISLETIQRLAPVFTAIKARQGHIWPQGDQRNMYDNPAIFYPQLTLEQIELFDDFCPRCEYGFHSIEEIRVFRITSEIRYV